MAEETKLSGPDWADVERVLVIMAHPDDPDFTCSGTVIQMARQGIEVTYMILTNGDKGNHNPEITRNQLIAMRKIEQRNSADDVRREAGAVHGRGGRLSAADAGAAQARDARDSPHPAAVDHLSRTRTDMW